MKKCVCMYMDVHAYMCVCVCVCGACMCVRERKEGASPLPVSGFGHSFIPSSQPYQHSQENTQGDNILYRVYIQCTCSRGGVWSE